MTLPTVWFVIVAFFWTGFFVLEGFDFGVGALHTIVGRTNIERRVAINTIGPFWDGNEVWLVVAGAAMFAAFPNWYASWLSSLYLALWLVLAALILRGVSIRVPRQVRPRPAGARPGRRTLTIGSVLAPLLIGVGLGDLLAGLPIDAAGDFTGSFLDLLTPFGLWVGLTLVALCLLHGASFLAVRCTGVVYARAVTSGPPACLPAAVLVVSLAIWTFVRPIPGSGHPRAGVPAVAAVAAAVYRVPARYGGATSRRPR